VAAGITLANVSGAACEPFLADLARLRIEIFRDFPYLYDGDLGYERDYLRAYVESPESIVVIASANDRIVGASTGLPLLAEDARFRAPFAGSPYDAKRIFYCGESVLSKAYRGRGLYKKFFERRERHARSLDAFDTCAFCAVDRPPEHPLRPPDYVPLDAAWTRLGYTRHPELVAEFAWKDVDRDAETTKPMIYWLKRLPVGP
jgi:GNAT superfamily N-acetyltransferase